MAVLHPLNRRESTALQWDAAKGQQPVRYAAIPKGHLEAETQANEGQAARIF